MIEKEDFNYFFDPLKPEMKKFLKLGDEQTKIENDYWKLHKKFVKARKSKQFDEAGKLGIQLMKGELKVAKGKLKFIESMNKAMRTKSQLAKVLEIKESNLSEDKKLAKILDLSVK
jgi:hypothetical protein